MNATNLQRDATPIEASLLIILGITLIGPIGWMGGGVLGVFVVGIIDLVFVEIDGRIGADDRLIGAEVVGLVALLGSIGAIVAGLSWLASDGVIPHVKSRLVFSVTMALGLMITAIQQDIPFLDRSPQRYPPPFKSADPRPITVLRFDGQTMMGPPVPVLIETEAPLVGSGPERTAPGRGHSPPDD